MSDRPPSPAASLTWRLSESIPLGVEADSMLRQRFAMLGAIGFLLGFFAMYNQWIQVAWVSAWAILWFSVGGLQEFLESVRQDRWFVATAGMLMLMLARSSLLESPGVTFSLLWRGWLSVGLLSVILITLWTIARQPRAPVWLGVPMVGAAVFTALGSIFVFYILDADAVFGARLRNWFIYGGWNSVCTGMTFGFAYVWATCAWCKAQGRDEKLLWLAASIVLVFAMLLTMSRGALLAAVVSHGVWLLAKGWREVRKPILLMIGCTVLFQCSAPLVSMMAVTEFSQRWGIHEDEVSPAMLADSVVPSNPAARVIERGDNGRFAIYAAAFHSMTTWQDWLLGKGLWAENDFWSCSLDWYPEHLHSIYMDALVRGGLPGLAALLAIIAWGLRRAFLLAREGEEIWLVLASFGVAGLVFDGQSVFHLLTLPRFETLLLWVPLVIASSRYTVSVRARSGFAKLTIAA